MPQRSSCNIDSVFQFIQYKRGLRIIPIFNLFFYFSTVKIDPEIKSTHNFSDLGIIPSKGDDHCILSSVISCMKHQNVHKVPSKYDLLNAIEFEILNNLDYYGRFLEANKDCVKELDDYRSMRKYSSATNDLVLIALTNYLQCCILLLKADQARRLYYLQCSDHCINPNLYFEIKVAWETL